MKEKSFYKSTMEPKVEIIRNCDQDLVRSSHTTTMTSLKIPTTIEPNHTNQLNPSNASTISSSSSSSSTSTSPAVTNGTGLQKNKKLFPQKLWDLINDEKYSFCLRWSDDGQLVYLNRDSFEDSYLKTVENQFHTQKAISFVRQMNMYGFRKVDDCYYENDNFKRDCEHLLKNMIRKQPNKQPVIRGMSVYNPYLSRQQINSTSSILQQQRNVQQQLQQPLFKPLTDKLSNCVQRNNFKLFNRSSQLINELTEQNMGNTKISLDPEDLQHLNMESEKLRTRNHDDSMSSSSDDYCCGAGDCHEDEILNDVLEQLEQSDGCDEKQQSSFIQQQTGLRGNHTRQKQPQDFSFSLIPQLSSTILNPIHKSTSNYSGQISYNNINEINRLPPQQQQNFLNEFLPLNLLRYNTVNNVTNLEPQQNLLNSLCNNPKDLMTALITQQLNSNNTQVPEDLTSNKIRTDNLDAFYSILASLSNNNALAFKPNSIQADSLDNLALSSRGSLNKSNPISLFDCQNKTGPQDGQITNEDLRLRNRADPLHVIEEKQLTAKNAKTNKTLDTFDCGKNKSINNLSINKTTHSSDLSSKRRDTYTAPRSFKRSVDSILESAKNNSNCNGYSTDCKRVKLEENLEEENKEKDHSTITTIIDQYAKNLVSQIASAKEMRLDSRVVSEASRYTEKFVEILFETAQVIARHSNGSISASTTDSLTTTTDNDNNLNLEDKTSPVDNSILNTRSYINLSDLNSALKLLPSKLLKILY